MQIEKARCPQNLFVQMNKDFSENLLCTNRKSPFQNVLTRT